MKTEGLTFMEAVQALKDGKCSGIRPACNSSYLVLQPWSPFPVLRWEHDRSNGSIRVDQVIGTWELIDPVPEKRTVKGWVNVRTNVSLPEGMHYYLSRMYSAEKDAMSARNGNREYVGPPLYIEHTYEVTK